MPENTQSDNVDSLNWRDRNLLPPDEPIYVVATTADDDTIGFDATWDEILGDQIRNPATGEMISIVGVRRTDGMRLDLDEHGPRYPYSVRYPSDDEWPEDSTPGIPRQTELDLRQAQRMIRHGNWGNVVARELGVSVDSVFALGAGLDLDEGDILTPEQNAYGEVCGITRRLSSPFEDRDGHTVTKMFVRGGKRGIYCPDNFEALSGAILVPEGFSDTAACLTMGFNAVGRPSATAGRRSLLNLLQRTTSDIVIVADRDDTIDEDNTTGIDAARKLARFLASLLRVVVYVVLPPQPYKDVRLWLNDFCRDGLTPERCQEAHDYFQAHIQNTAEIIEPGLHYPQDNDNRPSIALDEWRREMVSRRMAAIEEPGHYMDTSPTGSGKSFADRPVIRLAVERGLSVLVVVPTHANCGEEVEQLLSAGIEATAYPELSATTCERHRSATRALSQGLDLTRAVCIGCPLLTNGRCIYRSQMSTAREAQVAVCTTARLGLDASASANRKLMFVHEAADTAICIQIAIGQQAIVQAQRVLHLLLAQVNRDGNTAFGRAVQTHQETRVYVEALLAICNGFLCAMETDTTAQRDLSAEVPEGFWQRALQNWLRENHVPDETLESLHEDGFDWPVDRIDADALKAIRMVADGYSWDVKQWTSGATGHHSRIVVQKHLRTYDDQVWIWQDATGDADLLERLLQRPVTNITPQGNLEIVQQVEVVPTDITRRTAIQNVVDAIRSEVITTNCERLGVIGLKVHIDQIENEIDLLSPEIRERVHMMSYFGSGTDRASNRWLECDRILILGTPRIGDEGIRAELWRYGECEAAQIAEPGWIEYVWEARSRHEGDEPHLIGGRAYSNRAWHDACLRVTRAALQQAIGRGRGILETGLPVTVWTTERLSEYPVTLAPQHRTSVLNVAEVLFRATIAPFDGCRTDGQSRVWVRRGEIARQLDRHPGQITRVLAVAEEFGVVERGSRRLGWTLAETTARQATST